MTITAKYPGTCVLCAERFAAGDLIEWTKGAGSAHVECPPRADGSQPSGESAHQPYDNDTVQVTEPGVYENETGIYVVKLNREKTRLYAKRLVETAQRALEEGGRATFDYEYARGAIYDLTDADRMPLDRAKALTVRYGRCMYCGRRLKAAASVEAGIGPVCIKRFGPVLQASPAPAPAAPPARAYPGEGDRVTVRVLRGYKLAQERPYACRTWSPDATGRYTSGCKCGGCDGETTEYPGTVTRVIHYADNSIESEVLCDDGETRTQQHVAPHGDLC